MAPSTSEMPSYKTQFLQSCISGDVLSFGEFTLKSGRKSPYFFNAGKFHTASLLESISTAYAHTIISFLQSNPDIPKPDVLFGPAYKGIPLATTTLLALQRLSPADWSHVSYSFNRKEAKSHGEGGSIVGSPLGGKNVLVLDDVVTAGTAMTEAISIVKAEGGSVIGFVVALDRMERMPSAAEKEGRDLKEGEELERGSAMGMVRKEFGVRTTSVVTLDDLVVLLKESGESEDVRRGVEEYRERYKASD